MSGPEHYAKAEEFIEAAKDAATSEMYMARTATAQVHATLALVTAVRGGGDATWIETLA